MEQVLFGGFVHNTHSSTTTYNCVCGGHNWNSSEANRWKVVSAHGVFKNLRFILTGPPGAGRHFDMTLMVNSIPTALTLEIADLATTGNNMVDKVTVAPGDTVSIQCDPDSNPTSRWAIWSLVFEGSEDNESLIMGGTQSTFHLTDTEYGSVMGPYFLWSVIEDDFRQVMPTDGIIKDFYVVLDTTPGSGGGDAYRLTVRLNGATVAQSLIVTITQPATAGSDLIHNLAVVAGDVLTMMVEPINAPDATPRAGWGMTFVADIDGESVVLAGSKDDMSSSQTEYYWPLAQPESYWSDTEANRFCLGQPCVLKKYHVLLNGAPGAGNKYVFTIRIAGANSNVVVTVDEANTTGDSGALEDTIGLDETLSLKVNPDSGPTVRDAYWGFVSYILPPIPPKEGFTAADQLAMLIKAGVI